MRAKRVGKTLISMAGALPSGAFLGPILPIFDPSEFASIFAPVPNAPKRGRSPTGSSLGPSWWLLQILNDGGFCKQQRAIQSAHK